ncbi:MAG: hypothetical protein NTX53_06470 [candidate division WOR-3 bacterium]|nr:hypothetical protein [candidate division WOR-3 bacterium]
MEPLRAPRPKWEVKITEDKAEGSRGNAEVWAGIYKSALLLFVTRNPQLVTHC